MYNMYKKVGVLFGLLLMAIWSCGKGSVIIDADIQSEAETINLLELGAPCESDDNCESGYCVEGPDGYVCSVPCTDTCEEGYFCGKIDDNTSICLPEETPLCRPCLKNEECNNNGIDSGYKCISLGATGSFCMPPCGEKDSCKPGFVCKDVNDEKFCVPESGVCFCNQDSILIGASTKCFVENQYGKCEGERFCNLDGLSECSAKVPAPEDCDKVDNDCDGKTDEDLNNESCSVSNSFGVCVGRRICSDGKWKCEAATPEKEKCDGVDNDCDGVVDEEGADGCSDYYLDEDSDGFGTDKKKCLCQPEGHYTATQSGDCDDSDIYVFPGALEFCDGVDNDCNGTIDDEGAVLCTWFFKDADGDSFGVSDDKKCLCEAGKPDAFAQYTALQGGDCDDTNDLINPDVEEICNGIDDDCDSKIDSEFDESCWFSKDWKYKRDISITGNMSGKVIKDFQFGINLSNIIYNNSGLILSLHFNEGGGDKLHDSSGYDNKCEIFYTAQPKWDNGKEGSALNFDGESDCVKVLDSSIFNITQKISILAWINWEGVTGTTSTKQTIIARSRNCSDHGDYTVYIENGNIYFAYFKDGGEKDVVWKLKNQSDYIEKNKWYHIGATVDFEQGVLNLYINGEKKEVVLDDNSEQPGGVPALTGKDLYIGCKWNDPDSEDCSSSGNVGTVDYFNGTIDEIKIFNRVLSDNEISEIYNMDKGMYNGGDIRFTQDYTVYYSEIDVSEIGGNQLSDIQVKIEITDPDILQKMTGDGRDLRIYQTKPDKPYSETYTGLPLWIESLGKDKCTIWVNLSLESNETKKLYLYYGNPEAKSVSNFDDVFTKEPDLAQKSVVIYHFDKNMGETVEDSSPSGFDGIAQNAAFESADGGQWGEMRAIKFSKGGSIKFNGNNSQIVTEIPAKDAQGNDFVFPNSSYTIEFWVYPKCDGFSCGLFQMQSVKDDVSTYGNIIYLDGGKLKFKPYNDKVLTSTKSLSKDDWNYVVITHNGSDKKFTVYINGEFAGTLTLDANPFPPTGDNAGDLSMTIGYTWGVTHPFFTGFIDEFKILKKGVNSGEVLAKYYRSKWYFPKPQIDIGKPEIHSFGVAQLSYWVENDKKVWVKVPFIYDDNETKISLYYGNSEAYPQSNFSYTFTKNLDSLDSANLVGVWHFDAKVSTFDWFYDSSDYHHDGIFPESSTNWAPEDGGAWGNRNDITFDSGSYLMFNSKKYAVLRKNDNLHASKEFSVEFWIKWNGTNDNPKVQTILSKGKEFGFAVGNTGKIQGQILWYFNVSQTPVSWAQPTGITIEPNKWYHFACTYDGYILKFYKNGELAKGYSLIANISTDTSPLMIGAEGSADNPSNYFNGNIDELRIYHKTLHPKEVKAHTLRKLYLLPEPVVNIEDESKL